MPDGTEPHYEAPNEAPNNVNEVAAAPAERPTSLTLELFRKSLLIGAKFGIYTSPVTGYITLMVSAALVGDASYWLFGVVAIVLGSPVVITAGAVIGFISGAGSAGALLIALRRKPGSTLPLGTAGRVLTVAFGTAIAVGIVVVPLAATVLSSFYAAPFTIWALAVLVAGVVTARQGDTLARIQSESASPAA